MKELSEHPEMASDKGVAIGGILALEVRWSRPLGSSFGGMEVEGSTLRVSESEGCASCPHTISLPGRRIWWSLPTCLDPGNVSGALLTCSRLLLSYATAWDRKDAVDDGMDFTIPEQGTCDSTILCWMRWIAWLIGVTCLALLSARSPTAGPRAVACPQSQPQQLV